MMPPQPIRAKLADKQVLNDKYLLLSFELISPHRFEFLAGQYLSIKVSEQGIRRSYSICSSPDLDHKFDLLIDVTPQGIGTKFLQNLNLGDQIEALGPMGQFALQNLDQAPAINFVATGSGIAPLKSMLLDLLQVRNFKNNIILYWGERFAQNLIWLDEFSDLEDSFQNFKFHPVLSKSSPEWNLCKGRVTDCLGIHDLNQEASFYLCGSAQMIQDVNNILKIKNINNIYFEKFY